MHRSRNNMSISKFPFISDMVRINFDSWFIQLFKSLDMKKIQTSQTYVAKPTFNIQYSFRRLYKLVSKVFTQDVVWICLLRNISKPMQPKNYSLFVQKLLYLTLSRYMSIQQSLYNKISNFIRNIKFRTNTDKRLLWFTSVNIVEIANRYNYLQKYISNTYLNWTIWHH